MTRSNEANHHGDSTLPPWDLALYTTEYTHSRDSADVAVHHAQQSWNRFLSQRPLAYFPDRKPHSECDVRLDKHTRRRLWSHDELQAFADVVEQRTQSLLHQQHAVLHHWRHAATVIQAHTRGLLDRQRVQRMRQQLLEVALAAARAREFAAQLKRQRHAARRIQRAFRGHCDYLHYVYECRMRVKRVVGLYIFRWQRRRAAKVLQRTYRLYRRRVKLWKALRTVIRLLRMSRQRENLDAAAKVFREAHATKIHQERQRKWERHPIEMSQATRVVERKAMLMMRTRRPTDKPGKRSRAPPLPALQQAPSPARNQSSFSSSSCITTGGSSSSSIHRLPPLLLANQDSHVVVQQ